MDTASILINNTWLDGAGDTIQSIDPVYGNVVWEGRAASLDQVDSAVDRAQQAFIHWSALPLEERITIIQNYKQILETEKPNFARVISSETGKPIWEALNEVEIMINKIDVSISAHQIRTGEMHQVANGITLLVRHKPHGVMGVIGPYNFPGHIPNGHIIPALLAGNTIVYKPSEYTPLTAKFTLAYWINAGLPAGVMNLLIGGADIAKALVENSSVNGILFTGSYATGVQIHKALGGFPEKIVALEMGGNNPLIVSDIDDIDAAVLLAVLSGYLSSGQRCTCSRRLILVEDKNTIHFLNRLASVAEKISVDAYDASPQPFMSSITRPAFAQKLLAIQQQMIANEAQPIIQMHLLKENTGLLSPGLLDVTNMKNREDKEIFGPMLQVIRVKDFDSALIEANNTAYGLAAGLISNNLSQFQAFYNKVNAGIINWNRPTTGASSNAPFGGVGHSGNSRPGAFYTADSCAYPVATMETATLKLPEQLPIGLEKVFT
jgi:succinylglutamic semialdehyde dehydrogenase